MADKDAFQIVAVDSSLDITEERIDLVFTVGTGANQKIIDANISEADAVYLYQELQNAVALLGKYRDLREAIQTYNNRGK